MTTFTAGAFPGIDMENYLAHKRAGALEVHAVVCLCPACLQEWHAEYLGSPNQFAAKPDPVRLGPSLLCGSCEAKRRCYTSRQKGAPRFLGADHPDRTAETAAMWGRLRHQARNWVTVRNLGLWNGRELRDEKEETLQRILRKVQRQGGACVDEPLRQELGWEFPASMSAPGHQPMPDPQKRPRGY